MWRIEMGEELGDLVFLSKSGKEVLRISSEGDIRYPDDYSSQEIGKALYRSVTKLYDELVSRRQEDPADWWKYGTESDDADQGADDGQPPEWPEPST
jgi:hypothetical protein